ncbi:MAG TPA: anti-sigma factor [Casimicrobiaceae bacterium]|nr:anti-sigma factor [Casimicrobiaceae bacterium]
MNCKQAEMRIAAYCDGERHALLDRATERHLRDCAQCHMREEGMVALSARIRVEVPYYRASPALRSRVDALVGAVRASTPAQRPPARERWGWLSGGVVAGCTATVIAWMAGTTMLSSLASDNMAAAVVATHVRATLNDHLIDVASSDRHTVKPWLSARLDYSPPVHDLAPEGFPLIGGRLESVDGRRIATLVYRYREHTIDVFVFPERSHLPTLQLRRVRGFNVAHASGAGMEWCAVSDAEADILSEFVQRLAREEATH